VLGYYSTLEFTTYESAA